MNVTREINRETDKGKYVVATFQDIQNAFYTTEQRILLRDGKTRHFRTQRTIRTQVNRVTSQKSLVKRDLPQGSGQGLLFHIMYMNRIQMPSLHGTYTVFADNAVMLYCGKTKEHYEAVIKHDI